MSGMQQHLFEIDTYGFTLVEKVLNPDEVADIRRVNVRLLERFGEDLVFEGRAGHITNLPPLDPIFLPCIDHPRVLPILESVMDKDLILASLNSRVVRPGDRTQRLHADVPEQFRRPGAPVMMNTVWMLDDFSVENGATRIVTGSHRSSQTRPPGNVEVTFIHQAVAPAGSVLVFNGQCWHGGGENKTSCPRHALFGHYRVARWMRFQCDPHRGFPEASFRRLNDRQKQLLRMQKGLGHPTSCDYDEV